MQNLITQKLENIRQQYHINLKMVSFVAVSFFFLSIFDSIMSYIVPILMTDSGMSEFHMGILYSTSSLFGLGFDFILAKLLKTTHYQRTYTFVLLLAFIFPVSMLLFPSFLPFLFGMMIWALYYNLWAFSSADFTARESKVAFHVASVSFLFIFHDIGYIIGTLSAEKLLETLSYTNLMYLLCGLVFLSFICFLPILKRKKTVERKIRLNEDNDSYSNQSEIQRLLLVSKKLFPLLLLGVTAASIDAITWTVTPLIERVLPALQNLGGVVLAVNFLPSFIAYAFAGRLSSRFGKKRTGIITFILGSMSLAGLGFAQTVATYLSISFLSAFFISITYASIGGAFADYLNESKTYDSEIMSSRDMFSNLGYIIGPICGGALLSILNSTILFTYVGIVGAIIGVIVYVVTPKRIPFYDREVVSKS